MFPTKNEVVVSVKYNLFHVLNWNCSPTVDLTLNTRKTRWKFTYFEFYFGRTTFQINQPKKQFHCNFANGLNNFEETILHWILKRSKFFFFPAFRMNSPKYEMKKFVNGNVERFHRNFWSVIFFHSLASTIERASTRHPHPHAMQIPKEVSSKW